MQVAPSQDTFEQELRQSTSWAVRHICPLFTGVFVAWGAFDRLVAPEWFVPFLVLRVLFGAAALLGIAWGWPTARAWSGFAAWLAAMAVPVAFMIAVVDGAVLIPYVVGYVMFLIGAGVLAHWTTRRAVAAQIGLLAMALTALALRPAADLQVLVPCLFVLGTIGLLMLIIAHSTVQSKWQTFVARASLEAEKRETERLRARAEASDRAKSAFLANMSHELRTPLNVIIGYAQMLREDLGDDPEQDADLARIEASGTYLVRLVSDVLDLSKVAAGQLQVRSQAMDLGSLLHDVMPAARALCEHNGNTLVGAWPADLPACHADPIRLRQILLNLLSNAAKFTTEGTVTLGACRDAGGIRVSVSDTGIGIDPEQQDLLFRPFVQVHDEHHGGYGGTGLGLSLSRELARLMRGDITVKSTLGEGSTFRLVVPAAEPVR